MIITDKWFETVEPRLFSFFDFAYAWRGESFRKLWFHEISKADFAPEWYLEYKVPNHPNQIISRLDIILNHDHLKILLQTNAGISDAKLLSKLKILLPQFKFIKKQSNNYNLCYNGITKFDDWDKNLDAMIFYIDMARGFFELNKFLSQIT